MVKLNNWMKWHNSNYVAKAKTTSLGIYVLAREHDWKTEPQAERSNRK
jgi:hypothetical protein